MRPSFPTLRTHMATVVIEDQNPMMHRAKIRLGIATALLVIAVVSLLLAGKNHKPRPTAPQTTVSAVVTTPQKAPVVVDVVAEIPEEKAPPPPANYEAFPSLQSFTASPDTTPTAEEPAPHAEKELVKESNKAIASSDSGDFILQVGVFGDPNNAV